jgi:prophage regulatory protein
MADKFFPSSISLGDRALGWMENEIEEWIKSRISLSRGTQIN